MDRRQAEVRREEILRATARVVAKKGFARTRVADVATVLGISSGLVFYHFDTKERLLSEAYSAGNEHDLQTLSDTVTGPGSFLQRLRAVMRLYSPTGPAEAWSRDVDAWSEGLYTPEIQQACQRNDERWRAGFQELIDQGIAADQCQVDDSADAALRITVMLDGLAVATQVRGTISRETAVAWAAEHTGRILGIPAESLMPVPGEDLDLPGAGDAAPVAPREAMDAQGASLYS